MVTKKQNEQLKGKMNWLQESTRPDIPYDTLSFNMKNKTNVWSNNFKYITEAMKLTMILGSIKANEDKKKEGRWIVSMMKERLKLKGLEAVDMYYISAPNMKRLIAAHNAKLLRESEDNKNEKKVQL